MKNAAINGQNILVRPSETLLEAAHRQGVAIPFSCRMGVCGTCKCRLIKGRVKELTESAYSLTDDDITHHYILACQSVPVTDISVEVDIEAQPIRHFAHSEAIAQKQLVDDVTALEVPLEKGLPQEAVFEGVQPIEMPINVVAAEAHIFDYLKFFFLHAFSLASALAIFFGGGASTAALAAVLGIYLVGDQLLGDDISTPHYSYPSILTLQLWLTLPLLTLVVFAMIWSLSPGDPLGCGAWIKSWTGYDVFAQKEKANLLQQFSSIALTALMIGMVGTITAHELVHRTWDPLCLFIGRWLLAYSFDTSFSIEHVYGHHRYVSTASDPSTAPRGRNVYSHIAVSTLRGNVSAWRIERQRLQRTGRTAASWKNAVLRGYLMSFFLLATAWAIGGWQGILAFAISACLGKAVLETVTYVEHYGIVRVSGTPVEPRHSWNCTRRLSSWGSLNVTRHSHHHVQGEVPYHDLKPFVNAPMMFGGYPTTCLLALVPPLWHRVMTPKVLDWDVKHATEGERQLGGEANARSGITLFEQACK